MSKFIVVWCMIGLESCIPIDEYEHENDDMLMEMLKTGKPAKSKFAPLVQSLLLRAKFNQQTHYEIYAITATDNIRQEDIVEMFERNPQGSADTIRRSGIKLYSDRPSENQRIKIT
jgi:hypothetical protein